MKGQECRKHKKYRKNEDFINKDISGVAPATFNLKKEVTEQQQIKSLASYRKANRIEQNIAKIN